MCVSVCMCAGGCECVCVCVCAFTPILLVFLLPFDLFKLVFVTPVPTNCCQCNMLGALVVIVQAQDK